MAPQFEVGSRVRVRVGSPAGHFRTPGYVQGKVGRVEAIHGEFRNPESLAYDGDGLPKRALYLVGFEADQVWTEKNPLRHRVYVDLYEPWLEPARRTQE